MYKKHGIRTILRFTKYQLHIRSIWKTARTIYVRRYYNLNRAGGREEFIGKRDPP